MDVLIVVIIFPGHYWLVYFICHCQARPPLLWSLSFGKYKRILRPGLNIKTPFIEKIHSRVSIQNRSVELEFQATTMDQANVNFKAMLLFSVLNQEEDTIKNVAFKFLDSQSLMTALTRTIEGSIRSFVATKSSLKYFYFAPKSSRK